MKANFRLGATAVAVLTALGVTACSSGGGSSYYADGITAIQNTAAGRPNTQGTTTGTTTGAAGTSDTSAGTTGTNTGTTGNTTDATTPPPEGAASTFSYQAPADDILTLAGDQNRLGKGDMSSNVRGNLHDQLEAAYGQRFDTTFIYNTTILNATTSSPVTRTYLNAEPVPYGSLGNGYQHYKMDERVETHIDGVRYTGERLSDLKFYQQANSIILGKQTLSGRLSDGTTPKEIAPTVLEIHTLQGVSFDPPSAEELFGLQEAYDAAITAKDEASRAVTVAEAERTLARTEMNKAQNELNAARTEEAKAAAQVAYETAVANFNLKDVALTEARLTEATATTELAAATQKLREGAAAFNIWARFPDNRAARTLPTLVRYDRELGLDETRNNKIFSYAGQAFNQNSVGNLEYHINFNTRSGHGVITALDTGTINLNNANIGTVTHNNPDDAGLAMLGIQGVAKFADGRADGKYTLGIFGNEAQEIAGMISEQDVNTIGFGGVKTGERDSVITP
ncbi:MAG: factor H binding family protein [Moraxella sp.]|nr:factor H binding family protein [Moraxella sp.]